MQNSTRKLYAHWFIPWPVRVSGADNRTSRDYYDDRHLYFPMPTETAWHAPSDTAYDQYGGLFRNRPLPQPAGNPLSTYLTQDRQWQIREMIEHGFHGAYVECPWGIGSTELFKAQLVFDALAQMPAERDLFELVPMIDTSAGLSNHSPSQIASLIKSFTDKPYSYVDPATGRKQVAVYQPEGSSAATLLTPAHWQSVRSTLAGMGVNIDFTFCFQSKAPYNNDPNLGGVKEYEAVIRRGGRWGDRDPTTIGSETVQNRGQANANANRNWVQANLDQVGMTVAQRKAISLGYVTPGDERPNGKRYWENRLSESYRTSWDVVIGENNTPDANGIRWQPDIVQAATYDDFAEGAMVGSNMNYGFTMLDIGYFYAIRFAMGYWPEIERDTLYLFHRIEFSAGEQVQTGSNIGKKTVTSQKYLNINSSSAHAAPGASGAMTDTTLQSLQGSTAAADLVEALVFCTAPCTVEITVGDVQTLTTHDVTQGEIDAGHGVVSVTAPLLAGGPNKISARMTRGGVLVPGTDLVSPYAVSHINYSMDKSMRGGGSRTGAKASPAVTNGWTTTYPSRLPNQAMRVVT